LRGRGHSWRNSGYCGGACISGSGRVDYAHRLRGVSGSKLIGVVVPPQVPPNECGPRRPAALCGPGAPGRRTGGGRGYAIRVRRAAAVGSTHGVAVRTTPDLLPRRDRGRLAHRR
jgi:hypothetical protein